MTISRLFQATGGRLLAWAERAAPAATAAVAVGYLALFFYIAASRASYPFELEWIEGGMLHQVARVLEGEPLYQAPSLEYTPFIYPPAYFWLSAVSAKLVGLGFLALRAVSIAAAAGCFTLLFLLVRRETADPLAGLVAAGLFGACYHAGGAWLDLARVDSLFLCLSLASAFVLREARTWRGPAAAGLLACAACLTKQPGVLVFLLLTVYALAAGRGALRFIYGMTFGAGYGLATLLLQLSSDGWYAFYVFELPSHHPWRPQMYLDFWRADLLGNLPIACVLSVVALVLWLLRTKFTRWGFWTALLAGLVGAAWASRLHLGGWRNVLLPAFAAVALAGGVGFGALRRGLGAADAPPSFRALRAALYLAVLAQLLLLRYPVSENLPAAADREAGRAFVEHLRGIAGEVLIATSPYLAERAGKGWQAHSMALRDLARGQRRDLGDRLEEEIRQRVAGRYYARIYGHLRHYREALPGAYARTDFALLKKRFCPVTGGRMQPHPEYAPRPEDRDVL